MAVAGNNAGLASPLHRHAAGDPHSALPLIPSGARLILDIGCGSAEMFVGLQPPDQCLMFGVDLKVQYLIAAKASVPRANFARASSDRLPFPSQCFDFVAARVALPYMHIPTALAEMGRVLKPGGSVWLTLHPFSLVTSWLLQDLLAWRPKKVLFWLWVMVNGAFFHVTGRQLRYRSGRVLQETFQTEQSARRGLLAAGFQQVRISRGCHFVLVAIKARSL